MRLARDWARRAVLSALAGGGLAGAGVGGALPGGALADEGPTGGPIPSQPPSSTAQAPSPAPATTTTTTTAPPPGASSTTPGEPAPKGTAPSSGPIKPSGDHAHAPSVLVQRKQPSAIESTTPAVSGPVAPPPAAATPQPSPSANIAPAPQIAAGHVLSPGFGGSLVSMQALGFYRIPLFLLPIYQAASAQYGIPWQILAAINEVETNYGADLSVSTAGAVGWMQFMPETWLQYGVDAVNAGYADPYNPVDAIFAAARYLHAAGAATDLHAAILAYNHSEAYVESVLLRARLIASYPAGVIATLTGLTQGSLPVPGARLAAKPTSAGSTNGATADGVPVASRVTAAQAVESSASASPPPLPGAVQAPAPEVSAARAQQLANAPAPPSQLTGLVAAKNAPVLAVKDGRVVALGHSHKLGSYLVLRDTYGDVFTYAGLGDIAPTYRLAKPAQLGVPKGAWGGGEGEGDSKPTTPATAGQQAPLTLRVAVKHPSRHPSGARRVQVEPSSKPRERGPAAGKVRVFAHPGNPDALAAVLAQASRTRTTPPGWRPLESGALVAQGTVLGRVRSLGASSRYGSLRFALRPPGARSAIDPTSILENWRQLDAALHPQGAKTDATLAGAAASGAFLLGAGELERAVLSDPEIRLEACDRRQVAAGKVDNRLLALLVFLSRNGLKPTVSQVRCVHTVYTATAPASAYLPGHSMKITAINGVPIADHQGEGTITDMAIRTLLTAKRSFAPRRIVSLMKYPGASATIAEADHGDYIEVELPPRHVPRKAGGAVGQSARSAAPKAVSASNSSIPSPLLSSSQWKRLITRIDGLPNPKISRKPSSAAIADRGTSASPRQH